MQSASNVDPDGAHRVQHRPYTSAAETLVRILKDKGLIRGAA